MSGLTYEDLVAAATVGLSQRPLQIIGLSGAADEHAGLLDPGDEAAALLDAAALLVTARRAGVRSVAGLAPVTAAADDTAPELPARAADLLLAAGPVLLADLLGLAAGHGYRAPAPLLPVLLDAAVRDRGLTTAVAGVLGARGRWLAGHRADWQRVADAVSADGLTADARAASALSADASAPADPRVWETGSRSRRRAHLVKLRGHDPAAARELLAAGWSRESGDDRAGLLAILALHLSPADEEFVEAALDDRKASVRAEAARLLARLPGSAFNRRAAQRAAPLLRLEWRGPRRRLVASLPGGADAAAVRDGLSPGPRLMTQIVAAAPLAGWVTHLRVGVAELVSLPIAGDLAVVVRAGWRQAAIREADAQWAQALLAAGWPGAAGGRPPATWPPDHELAAVLPPDARAARAASLLAHANTGAVAEVAGCPAPWPAPLAEVAGCPAPWPAPLADAVISALGRAVTAAAPVAAGPSAATAQPGRPPMGRAQAGWPGWPAELAAVAGRGLPAAGPADYAAALARLAGTGNCPAHWSSALRRAAEAVALRRAFLKEIR